jgi:hypothetical protein
MSDMESAACWARDTTLGWLILLMLHDRRFARRVRLWVLGVSFLAIGKIVIDEESKRAKESMRIC